MHTVFTLLCFVVVIHWLIFPYPSGLLHWHCGNLTIAPVPAKQPWWIWINTSCQFIMNDCVTTTKKKHNKTVCIFLGIYCIFVCPHYIKPSDFIMWISKMKHVFGTDPAKHLHIASGQLVALRTWNMELVCNGGYAIFCSEGLSCTRACHFIIMPPPLKSGRNYRCRFQIRRILFQTSGKG